jgi:Nucleotide modification associated domain 2
MARLFTYTIPIDDGAAPNPFHGMCSLAICKPSIRRVAAKGDWVAGLGSKNVPSGDLSGRLVYAMQVEEVVPMSEYDRRAPHEWDHRIPKPTSRDLADRLGDCIYDYSAGDPPYQRASVHGPGNLDADLSGENVLISADFYYLGSNAIPLPPDLLGICHQTQGHRSNGNISFFDTFVHWVRGLKFGVGQLYGWPDTIVDWRAAFASLGCASRAGERADDPVC